MKLSELLYYNEVKFLYQMFEFGMPPDNVVLSNSDYVVYKVLVEFILNIKYRNGDDFDAFDISSYQNQHMNLNLDENLCLNAAWLIKYHYEIVHQLFQDIQTDDNDTIDVTFTIAFVNLCKHLLVRMMDRNAVLLMTYMIFGTEKKKNLEFKVCLIKLYDNLEDFAHYSYMDLYEFYVDNKGPHFSPKEFKRALQRVKTPKRKQISTSSTVLLQQQQQQNNITNQVNNNINMIQAAQVSNNISVTAPANTQSQKQSIKNKTQANNNTIINNYNQALNNIQKLNSITKKIKLYKELLDIMGNVPMGSIKQQGYNASRLHAENYQNMARSLLRSEMTTRMKKNFDGKNGFKKLLQLSNAANNQSGEFAGYFEVAPGYGEYNTALRKLGIDPQVAILTGSLDNETNKYLKAVGNLEVRNETKLSLIKTEFEHLLKQGHFKILDNVQGKYQCIKAVSQGQVTHTPPKTKANPNPVSTQYDIAYTYRYDSAMEIKLDPADDKTLILPGDILMLDRMRSGHYENVTTPVFANVTMLSFVNLTAKEEEYIKERYELGFPITPIPSMKRGRKKRKGKTKSKTGGKKRKVRRKK